MQGTLWFAAFLFHGKNLSYDTKSLRVNEHSAPTFVHCLHSAEREDKAMVIGSSNISMGSKREFATKAISQRITTIGNEVTEYLSEKNTKESSSQFKDVLGENSMKGEMDNSLNMREKFSTVKNVTNLNNRMNMRRIRQQTIMHILMQFRKMLYDRATGKSGEDFHKLMQENSQQNAIQGPQQNSMESGANFATPVNNILGSHYEYDYYGEYESTLFETTGKVVTADGREIDFNVNVSMTRSFETAMMSGMDIVAEPVANFVDPLVINLDNNVASVSDQKFLFDIDSDGVLDSISGLNKGSGFLALDINGDGVINDGSELFGTKSGSGFRDLAAYDEDGNGWIDENDSIFDKLLIWTKDENGKDELYHLKESGVGALYVESVSTDFALNNLSDNKTNAKIRETGIFLYENGGVGTMQHLDLAT